MEIDEGMMLLGLRAAAWGCLSSHRGRAGHRYHPAKPGIKLIDSPYDDGEWVAMPALKLDAALIHVDRADVRGVCQIAGPDHYLDDWYARAASKTYVSCDELVETDFFRDPARPGWCSGSGPPPPAWCIFPAALTPLPATRCMALTYLISRPMPPPRVRAGLQLIWTSIWDLPSRNTSRTWVAFAAIRAIALPTY